MIVIPNEILFEEVERRIATGERVLIRLQGDSMLPMMHGGRDVVELGPVEEGDLRRGAVVLCRYRGRHILHRIVKVGGGGTDGSGGGALTLMGDGSLTLEHVAAGDVVAVMRSLHRPGGRVVDTASRGWQMRSRVWMALRPARRYILGLYRRLG